MAKSEEVKYSDAQRFDADFKKRQSEIHNEILIWSRSESFQLKIREQALASLSNHDVLVDLSKRLFETGNFTSKFKEITKTEIELNNHKTWMERISSWFKFFAAGVMGAVTILLGQFLINKFL